jgi:glutathionylspermidine synthase
MQRIPVDERSNWRDRAEQSGFVFHSVNGERYWEESAYYAFSLKEIEGDLEAPTAALDAMCRELVGRAVVDDRMMPLLSLSRDTLPGKTADDEALLPGKGAWNGFAAGVR